MPPEPLDERYLTWLYSQVSDAKTKVRSKTYWSLFRQMHKTIFVSIVPHDENRIADGKDLRYEFLAERQEEQGDLTFTRSPCSMLELLIVLARGLAFEMDEDVDVWFWHLIEVLELEEFNDRVYDDHIAETVEKTLDRVIWRKYRPDGRGGLFPLEHAHQDQRDVELWYQLNAYLLEQF